MRIFLSYGRDEHIELAKRLKTDLKARGHEVWFDEDCLKPGFDWEYYIEKGLKWCVAGPEQGRVVVLMTPHAVRRPEGYCLNEIARALIRSLLIVPVMVVSCEPPLSICRIQWLDMRDCVPVTDREERYELKRDRLIEALEIGKLDFEGTQSILLHLLKPLDFAVEIVQHVQNFVGRKWVFKRIDDWLTKPNQSRIFWITGSPGVGKTAIAAYLCHKWREVIALHFCRHGHDDKSDPRRCVMSLAYQLSSQLPDYQQRLEAMDLRSEVTKSAATLFDNLIVQPLSMTSTAPDRTFLIVIDGLDEATCHGRNEMADFIARQFPRTPAWLRLVITSRPDPEVVQPLQELSPYYLDASLPDNLEDIRTYLHYHLPLCSPQQAADEQIIDTIVEKSEGTFLYVERLLADLKEGRLVLDRVDESPQGLGGSFFQFFTRQFPDITAYQQCHRSLLEMIIAARGPLPLKLAQEALQWEPYDYQVDQGEVSGAAALTPLGSLFLHKEGHIRPFHQSIIDWLTNLHSSGPYFVDMRQGHERLADVCWGEYQTGHEKMSSYSLAHLPTHLMEVERWDDLLDLVICPELGFISNWIEKGEGDKGITCLTGLINYLEKHNRQPVTSAGLATQLARIYSIRGEYDNAQNWLKHALKLSSWWRGRRVRAVALHELGSLELYQINFRQAMCYYRQALRLCFLGLPVYHDEAAANMIGLASVSQSRYRFSKTIRFATKALQEAKKSGDIHHIIASERLIGAACKSLGRYTEAEFHLQAATLLCEKFKVHLEKARLLLLIGWLQYDQAILKRELPTETKKYFQEALVQAERVHEMYCLIEAKIALGRCALLEKATSEALSWLKPLKEALPPGRHPELQVGVELGLAGVIHQQGNLEAAEKLYREVISFCGRHNISVSKCRAMIGLGATYWHTGRSAEAEVVWEQALQFALRISQAKRSLAQISIEFCRVDSMATPR